MNTLLKQGNTTNMNVNMDTNTALNAVKRNPSEFLRSCGISTPDNLGNNPQSIVNYLLNSNQVNPARKQIAKMAMNKLGL